MYEKSKEAFSEQEFQAPGREYRGAPFWSWNGKLEQSRIDEQLRVFQKMGFGGYHIHSRIGLETEYLGKEFMQLRRRAWHGHPPVRRGQVALWRWRRPCDL